MKFAATHLSVLALALTSTLAQAGTNDVAPTPVTVQVDQSQLVMLNADPATVVVGNPMVADVSLNGKQMFLHGHTFGETNIMIFDNSGNKILNYMVSVSYRTDNQLTMYSANSHSQTVGRQTYVCAPNCEGTVMAGDASSFFSDNMSSNQSKYQMAIGAKSSDVNNKSQSTPQ